MIEEGNVGCECSSVDSKSCQAERCSGDGKNQSHTARPCGSSILSSCIFSSYMPRRNEGGIFISLPFMRPILVITTFIDFCLMYRVRVNVPLLGLPWHLLGIRCRCVYVNVDV